MPVPYSNVNSQYVNVDSSNWPGTFGSNQTSLEFGLPALRNNVDAANASRLSGGARRKKTLRRKIKNIVHMYKMPRRNKHSIKRKLKSLYKRGRTTMRRKSRRPRTMRHRRSRSMSKSMKGGRYEQYGNNIPNTPSYSTGGILASNNLGMANPVPYQGLPCTTNCVDNYNYNTNKGFQI